MIDEVRRLNEEYAVWLRDRTSLRQLGDWVEVTTPYLDRHNDRLQIYLKKQNGAFLLTDDGYILRDLELSGFSLDSKKRQELLRITLNGFGIKQEDDALVIHATPDNFAYRKHSLIQAMLAVNDMFYLAQPMVVSIFLEDVAQWLDFNDVRYSPRVKFTGKSGYDHSFDFLIPKSRVAPERLVRAINHPSRDTAETTAFSWEDTREVRPPDSRLYALLNDGEHAPAIAVTDALKNYGIHSVLWSEREKAAGDLRY